LPLKQKGNQMLHTVRSYRGMMTAPHHLASQAGLRVLQEGGNAVEAMVAAASTIAVAYPHMNGLGGDNFWLIHTPDSKVIGIDACGGAAGLATIDFYKDLNLSVIPSRGPLSALTVGGAVSGWQAALTYTVPMSWVEDFRCPDCLKTQSITPGKALQSPQLKPTIQLKN
jgi:gamma-glutamyltranspeptidase